MNKGFTEMKNDEKNTPHRDVNTSHRLTLLCEMCKVRHTDTALAVFEESGLCWPLDFSIFKSHVPELLPDPFPVGLEWHEMRCRQCGGRPFLNFIDRGEGLVMLVDGTRKKKGAEGRLLTLERGYIPIPGYTFFLSVLKIAF